MAELELSVRPSSQVQAAFWRGLLRPFTSATAAAAMRPIVYSVDDPRPLHLPPRPQGGAAALLRWTALPSLRLRLDS